MAAINDLINQIDDLELRERIKAEVDKLSKQKKFGLVFEDHVPECTALYDVPVHVGSKVALKDKKINDVYVVKAINDNQATCVNAQTKETAEFNVDSLVSIAEFGEAIYPYLKPIDSIENATDSSLWHTLIEADNYHALQLLEYLYAGKVDCIYIDPPYNTGAKDWKYNNDYVDSSDAYRHSKWLSMMEKRLKLAKKLLNPADSVLIVTIDEKEYLHLGCLLEELFPDARMQMVSSVINSKGVSRGSEFFRVNEYLFFVKIGDCSVSELPLQDQWLGNIKTSTTKQVRWGSLMRSGSGSDRKDSPGCFYPIYISKDKTHFCGAGEVVPVGVDRNTVAIPKDVIAIFPIRENGTEGRWQYSREKYLNLQAKGYARISTQTKGKKEATIRYISEGWQKRVESGEIKVTGTAVDGSLIFDDKEYEQKYIPGNQWWIASHDATEFGSKLLTKLIGKRFTFPKSLYAVHDSIRFFVANKPNALILDFFAGSGTTLHAVNLLNAEDGGHRRCIMVTNNEVSDEEAKKLKKNGFKPGDPEWERLGIAHYVTWPRTVCSIKGEDINGNPLKENYGCPMETYSEIDGEVTDPETGKKIRGKVYKKIKKPTYPELEHINMSDGFKANAAFFKLGFLDKNAVALGRQFKELLPVLWMKTGCVGLCPKLEEGSLPSMLILPQNAFAVLIDEHTFPEFMAKINDEDRIKQVFIVTDSTSGYREMISHLSIKKSYQLYRDYLDNFRINTGR